MKRSIWQAVHIVLGLYFVVGGSTPLLQAQSRSFNSEGYPIIEGSWYETDTLYPIKITQKGGDFVAIMTERDSHGVLFTWRMEGKLSPEGKLTGLLQYTEGLKPSDSGYRQAYAMTLSPDGELLDGRSQLPGGGGSHVAWRRYSSTPTSASSSSRPPSQPAPVTPPSASGQGWRVNAEGYPDISGVWEEMPDRNRVQLTQTGGTFVAAMSYGNPWDRASWRMTGTVSKDGEIVGKLVHTEGVPPSGTGFAQDRNMALSADGKTLLGRSTFTNGSHAVEWRKVL
jgi:hypothetical protein